MVLMKKVLMIVDTSRLTGRDLLSGAEKYISSYAHWEVYTLDPNYLSDDFSKEVQRLDLGKFDGFFVCYTKNISSILKTKKPKIIHCTPKEMLAGTSLVVTNSSIIWISVNSSRFVNIVNPAKAGIHDYNLDLSIIVSALFNWIYYYSRSIRSRPCIYGRNASGIVTDPSAFW